MRLTIIRAAMVTVTPATAICYAREAYDARARAGTILNGATTYVDSAGVAFELSGSAPNSARILFVELGDGWNSATAATMPCRFKADFSNLWTVAPNAGQTLPPQPISSSSRFQRSGSLKFPYNPRRGFLKR